MRARQAIAASLAARDPGRSRLIVAVSVSAGVLASALCAMLILSRFPADKGLLAMAIFLSLQAGNMVKDTSAIGRVTTTALLLPALVLAIVAAALLAPSRPAVIAVFVAVTGAAIWVRRFGPRAAAIGSLSFMGYFFTLFMQPSAAELPVFCLIAATAVATQLVARSVLLLQRPRRQIAVLLRELRAASAAALAATTAHAAHEATLRSRLARIDEVGRAITSWQERFPTGRYVACEAQTLESLVLDARVDTEETCYELAGHAASRGELRSPAINHALAQLSTVLDERATGEQVATATAQASSRVELARHRHGDDLAVYLIARNTIAHAKVREINLARGLTSEEHAREHGARSEHPPAPTVRLPRPRWVPWAQWAPTSRMAVQAMVAAALASAVGEAISASRWYWAVMTAFVIFIGASTRSGILTRAFRRVIGTALGIGVGVGAVALAGDHSSILVSICVLGVFGMLYFGPLNYVYASIFMTIMLVAMYRLLGVLDQSILDLRLVETLTGAVIGVLSAYLVLSSNSRPVLQTQVAAYFDALDGLLATAASRFDPSAADGDPLASLRALEAAQASVDQTLAGMSAAFLVGKPRRESEAVHLMYITTRSAARLAQSAADCAATATVPAAVDGTLRAVGAAIDEVRASARAVRGLLIPSPGAQPHGGDRANVTGHLDQVRTPANSPEVAAIMALARMHWALRRIVTGEAPRSTRRSPAAAEPTPRASS